MCTTCDTEGEPMCRAYNLHIEGMPMCTTCDIEKEPMCTACDIEGMPMCRPTARDIEGMPMCRPTARDIEGMPMRVAGQDTEHMSCHGNKSINLQSTTRRWCAVCDCSWRIRLFRRLMVNLIQTLPVEPAAVDVWIGLINWIISVDMKHKWLVVSAPVSLSHSLSTSLCFSLAFF